MRWVLRIAVFLVILGVGAAVVVGLSHFSPTEVAQPPAELRPPPEQAPNVPPPPPGAQWRYTDVGGSQMACTRGHGDVAIGPSAQSLVLLCLRRDGVASIALADHSGRFACGDCQLAAKLDGAPRSFAGSTASTDGTAFTIFLKDGAGFAAELRHASALSVTLPIKGTGDQTATFDVAALRWN